MSKDTPFIWDTKLLCQNFSFSFIIRQDAGSVTYEYNIYFSPGSASWSGDESGQKSTTVYSEKRKFVNGKLTEQIPVDYNATFSGDTGDFNYRQSGDTFYITPQGTNDSGIDYNLEINAYIKENSSTRDTFTCIQYTI